LSYIGKTPTPAPLTSSDITDGIITTTKIADANVTNPKLTSGSQQNFRNIIINGDMSIAQRGTSVSGVGNGDSGYHTCDRWKFFELGAGTGEFTQSQSTDVPTGQGFATSLKMDCTTADASLAAADVMWIQQIVEAQNLQYIKKGTSSAESLTLSFWVYATKTGTNICELYDENNRQVSKSYTISSSNTWEKKTITFPADTSGALGNDNGIGMYVNFFLLAGSNYTSGTLSETWTSATAANRGVGQVNHADNTSNNFYITGVQLEAGTTASDFEFLPADVNLQRCQRYYYTLLPLNSVNKYFLAGYYYSTNYIYCNTIFPTVMRTSPSLEQVSGTNYFQFYSAASGDQFDDFTNTQTLNPNSAFFGNNGGVSGTAGNAGAVYCGNNAAYVAFTAEL